MRIILITLFTFISSLLLSQPIPNDSIDISKYVLNTNVSGRYSIWYKLDNGEINKITRPFMICEGIDPLSEFSGIDTYDQMHGGFLSCLRNRGYDIIILDLDKNTLDIRKNAKLFIKLIEEIKTTLDNNGSNNRITVGGVSMGGLITRYALAKMEQDGLDHRVDRFITFDTPHKGANVPLGYQHFLNTWLSPVIELQEASAALDYINANPLQFVSDNLLNKAGPFLIETAAIQMAANYYKQNPLRYAFLQSLQNVGDYPTDLRKIAVSNGANVTGQDFAGNRLFDWSPGVCLIDRNINLGNIWGISLGSYHLRWCPLTMANQVNTMPGDFLGRVYNFNFGQQLSINGNIAHISDINKFNIQHDYLNPLGDYNMDDVPGGYYDLFYLKPFAEFLNTATTQVPINWSRQFCISVPYVGTVCRNIGYNTTIEIPWYKILGRMESETDYKFTFVPTLSALDMNLVDWDFDLTQIQDYPYPKSEYLTPFNAIFLSEENSYHAYLEDPCIMNNLVGELAPNDLYIQNRTFDSDYTNTFIAENITIGNNVDIVPNRTDQGDVITETGAEINFVASNIINIEDGFDSNNASLDFSIDQSLSFDGCGFSCTSKKSSSKKYKEYIVKEESSDIKINSQEESLELEYSTTISTMNGSNNFNNSNVQFNTTTIDVNIFPNPTNGIVNIGINLIEKGHLSIYVTNSFGQTSTTLMNNNLLSSGIYKFSFDLSKLDKGVYFIKVQTEKNIIVKKLIIN